MPSATSRARVMAKLVPALERLMERYDTFTEISVEALMSEAGMSRRSFYAYFEDKGQLMAEAGADVIDRLTGAWPDPSPADPDRTDLDRALAELVAAYRPHRNLLRAVAETTGNDPRVAEVYQAGLGRIADRLAAHITAGQADGTVRSRLHPPITATWLTVLLATGLARLTAAPADEQDRHLAAARAILTRVLHEPAARPADTTPAPTAPAPTAPAPTDPAPTDPGRP